MVWRSRSHGSWDHTELALTEPEAPTWRLLALAQKPISRVLKELARSVVEVLQIEKIAFRSVPLSLSIQLIRISVDIGPSFCETARLNS